MSSKSAPASYGVVTVVADLWQRLGTARAIEAACASEGCTVPYERALFAMVANRLDEPMSKLGLCERWLQEVHLPSAAQLTVDQHYAAMDLLYRHREDVERNIFFQTAQACELTVDLIFYDTTTVRVEIDDPDEEGPRQWGRSKDRDWAVQVVALAVTRNGIPIRSWVLPGNTNDATTVEQVRADLVGWRLGRTLFVGDSGMNTTETRETLARACGSYVLACRAGVVKEVAEQVLTRAGRYKVVRDNLRIKEVFVSKGEKRRRYVVCHNPRQAERQRAHRQQVLADLEAKFERHTDRDARCKWVAELRTSGRTGRFVKLDAQGQLGWVQATEYETPTHRFVRTNHLRASTLELLEKFEIAPPKQILEVRAAA